jgi:polar amino acid transport system substrate-binding protein
MIIIEPGSQQAALTITFMRQRHLRALGMAAATSSVLFLGLGCAPVDSSTPARADDPAQSESVSGSPEVDPAACAATAVRTPGTLTIGTDSPAYDPWFSKNDPTNGEGFESAVAYAVAEKLGFTGDQVKWTKVPFNSSYAPGAKSFDFDINQISITAKRAEVVDFSDGYYQAAQAVIMLKGPDAEGITSVQQLKGLRLGAQTGTTSLTAIRDVIQPDADPVVFKDTSAAKQALLNDQVDAILADLPTAFYITAVEIPKGTIVGQFQPETGKQEEFGMLFEKGSNLVQCVNQALTILKDDGTLQSIEDRWLSDAVEVPELTP